MNQDKVVIPSDAPTWAQRLQPDFNRVFGGLWTAIKGLSDALANFDTSTFLAKGSNLSDLTNAATARTNLGLGSAAQRTNDNFVRTDVPQTLAVAQQLIARANINVGRGQFPVEVFGATGNISTDPAAFNAAVLEAVAAGGGVITGRPQSYLLNQTSIPIVASDNILFVFPNATIVCKAVTADNRAFIQFNGSLGGSRYAVTNYPEGQKSINLNDITGIGQGSFVYIQRQDYGPDGQPHTAAYVSRVSSTAGGISPAGSVGLETRLPFNIVNTYGHSVSILTPRRGCGVIGLNFDASGMTGAVSSVTNPTNPVRPRAPMSVGSESSEYDGIKIDRFGFLAFETEYAVDDRIGDILLTQCGNSEEPDFRLYASTFTHFRKVHSRLAGSGPQVFYGHGNTGGVLEVESAVGRSIKMGGDRNTHIEFIRTTGSGATGLAMSSQTRNLSVGRLEAEYNGGLNTGGGDMSGVWSENSGCSCSIDSASFVGNSAFDVCTSANDRVRIRSVDKIDVAKLGPNKMAIEGIWRPYVPTARASSGDLGGYTIDSAKWMYSDGMVTGVVSITVTDAGTAPANAFLIISVPTTGMGLTGAPTTGYGRETIIAGCLIGAQIASGTEIYIVPAVSTQNIMGMGAQYQLQFTYPEDLMA